MMESVTDLNDPNPQGRSPLPEVRMPQVMTIFKRITSVQMAVVFVVNAEDVLQSGAMFGVWLEEEMAHEDKREILRQLAASLHEVVYPDYYLDLMLISPRDPELWNMVLVSGDVTYLRDHEVHRRLTQNDLNYTPIVEEERTLEIVRVL